MPALIHDAVLEEPHEIANARTPIGATYVGKGRCTFLVWAAKAQKVELHLLDPKEQVLVMEQKENGYYELEVGKVTPGTRYFYRLDSGPDLPDPASRRQPEGVHGPSAVVDPNFDWKDGTWRGLPLEQYILYELHVGTFSAEGTFDGVIPYLDRLVELGVTAIELMPVAQFPGERNWGYDLVYPFAVQESYGGLEGLKRLVNACHQRGLALALDVIYNHLGPEGNYLPKFGPYFTERHMTAWGPAINYDGVHSDEVRRYYLENALFFLRDCHVDMLRLDAVDHIFDNTSLSFLEELAMAVKLERSHLNRQFYLVAETSSNDPRLVRPIEAGGIGIDGQWNDEFHHALHTLLTGESIEYYNDYVDPNTGSKSGSATGSSAGSKNSVPLWFLIKAYREGFIYSGQYSRRMGRRHGKSSRDIPAERMVVFLQNHDHIGNRMLGERISELVSFEQIKLAAGAYLLSPYLPLLFMGEEYADPAPFQFFVSHSQSEIIEAVRKGRRADFAGYHAEGEPPDPLAEETFQRCKLDHMLANKGEHRKLRDFYRQLLQLRKTVAPLYTLDKERMEVAELGPGRVLFVRRWFGQEEVFALYNFDDKAARVQVPVAAGPWRKLVDSTGKRIKAPAELSADGPVKLSVQAQAFLLYERVIPA